MATYIDPLLSLKLCNDLVRQLKVDS